MLLENIRISWLELAVPWQATFHMTPGSRELGSEVIQVKTLKDMPLVMQLCQLYLLHQRVHGLPKQANRRGPCVQTWFVHM